MDGSGVQFSTQRTDLQVDGPMFALPINKFLHFSKHLVFMKPIDNAHVPDMVHHVIDAQARPVGNAPRFDLPHANQPIRTLAKQDTKRQLTAACRPPLKDNFSFVEFEFPCGRMHRGFLLTLG